MQDTQNRTLLETANILNIDWREAHAHLTTVSPGKEFLPNPEAKLSEEQILELRRAFPITIENVEEEIFSGSTQGLLSSAEKIQLEEEWASKIDLSSPINPDLVDIEHKSITLDLIIKRLREGEIQLDPEFQRAENLWDLTKQSRLIESILIKFPLPAFYFDGQPDGQWAVVDGLQRLSTLQNFILKGATLRDLEFLPLNGKKYADLPRPLQRRIEETNIFIYIIKPGTPDDVKYNIFKRINTGGLILTPQEIRHALNQGLPAQTIKWMAEQLEFKQATSYSVKTNRMLDRDFVNRFVAFYILGHEQYKPDLDSFLNKGMASINKSNVEELKSAFIDSMKIAFQIFEWDAFRKRFDNNHRRKPLNKALFDSLSVNFAKLDDSQRVQLIQRKEIFKTFLQEKLNSDSYFSFILTYSTGDKNKVTYRFETIRQIIEKVLEQ